MIRFDPCQYALEQIIDCEALLVMCQLLTELFMLTELPEFFSQCHEEQRIGD